MLARLSEPSTYAGIGTLLALAGIHAGNDVTGPLSQILAGIAGLAAILVREKTR